MISVLSILCTGREIRKANSNPVDSYRIRHHLGTHVGVREFLDPLVWRSFDHRPRTVRILLWAEASSQLRGTRTTLGRNNAGLGRLVLR